MDVKPENLMIKETKGSVDVKIIDFGHTFCENTGVSFKDYKLTL